ncbi:MAG TPA: efflux RND transporter periplasmic adaptor subunit [Acidobacteriaceae bacterium]|nr:efflux RND transporter periplasmic adaptor subunit [Acidobacteriaceae bacterium]
MTAETEKNSNHSRTDGLSTGSGGNMSLEPTRKATRRAIVILIVLLIVAAVVAITGILPRLHARAELAKQTDSLAVPMVSVVTAQPGAPTQEIVLPGTIQAYRDAPIYARTSGYVKSWSHDIGTHVKKGELLAVIETPELDRQVDQARANLATAQANLRLSRVTAQRYQGLQGSEAVSQQSIDTAAQNEQAQAASVAVAQQSLNQLLEMQGFERLYAPFDGIVTARNTDVGQLVDSGSNGGTGSSSMYGSNAAAAGNGLQELFRVSNLSVARIFVQVPEVYVPDARTGVETGIDVPGYPGRVFQGKIVRTANALDLNTRTLTVEVDIDNRKSELLPGSYAQVHLKLPMKNPVLIIPVSALMFRSEGLRVVTLDDQNRARLQPIRVGRDWGTQIEVLSGLTRGARIVDNPPDSIAEGEKVNVSQGDGGSSMNADQPL